MTWQGETGFTETERLAASEEGSLMVLITGSDGSSCEPGEGRTSSSGKMMGEHAGSKSVFSTVRFLTTLSPHRTQEINSNVWEEDISSNSFLRLLPRAGCCGMMASDERRSPDYARPRQQISLTSPLKWIKILPVHVAHRYLSWLLTFVFSAGCHRPTFFLLKNNKLRLNVEYYS